MRKHLGTNRDRPLRYRKKTKRKPQGGLPVPAVCLAVLAGILLALLLTTLQEGGATAEEKPILSETGPAADSELPEEGRKIRVYYKDEGVARETDLETYILGVTAAEMPASFEPEALSAQAVAARTYAASKEPGGCGREGADVCTDSGHCQAYCSPEAMREKWGSDFDRYYEKLQKAVEQTKGQVLIYEEQPIEALYHAASAGATEDVEHVYAQNLPYLRGVDSPEEEITTTKAYSLQEFAQMGNAAYPQAKLAQNTLQAQVLSRYESGRVKLLQLGKTQITGAQARKLFDLASTHFSLEQQGEEAVFTVRGSGHGVGMSQRGAQAMAKEGADFEEILLHYYSDVYLGDWETAS